MEKTIEERAKEAYPHYSAENSERVMGARAGYIQGCKEQQKIDEQDKQEALTKQKQELIEKAYETFCLSSCPKWEFPEEYIKECPHHDYCYALSDFRKELRKAIEG